jgi:hypothetical protein
MDFLQRSIALVRAFMRVFAHVETLWNPVCHFPKHIRRTELKADRPLPGAFEIGWISIESCDPGDRCEKFDQRAGVDLGPIRLIGALEQPQASAKIDAARCLKFVER